MSDINITHIVTTIAGVLIAGGMGDIIRRLYRMEKKQDDQAEREASCRESLKDYAKWEHLTGETGVITEIKRDRVARWKTQDELNMSRERDITKIKTKLEMQEE